jgi:hypothetical protein
MEEKIDLKAMEKSLDMYGAGLFDEMYKDPSVDWISGDSVDDEGHPAYCFFDSGKKLIASFNNVVNDYKGKASEIFNNIGNYMRRSFYDHETIEAEDKGKSPHYQLNVRDIKRTKNPILRMAKLALLEIGLNQKMDDAKETIDNSDLLKEIRSYRSGTKEGSNIYKTLMNGMKEYLGMVPQGTALAPAEVD